MTFNGRQCLALPLHGPDLYVLQKARGRKPFPFDFVVASAHQLLSALGLLGQLNLVHADLKPQNVALPSLTLTLILDPNPNTNPYYPKPNASPQPQP